MKLQLVTVFLSLSGLITAQSYARDVKMGAQAALDVEKEMGLYTHRSLLNVVEGVGQKLVASLEKKPTEFQFQFHIADTREPNAFALPGGHIYVTRGILLLVQTEDELAGIMAHEIIHVMKRHSVKQFNRQVVPAALKIPGNMLPVFGGKYLFQILSLPVDLLGASYIASYSRDHEREADKLGVELAARAGYNSRDLAGVLNRLSAAVEILTGENEKRNFFNDHPYTPERVSAIQSMSTGLPKSTNAPIYASQAKFIRNFQGLCVGNNPKYGVFVDSLFVHPLLNFSMLMPGGWDLVNEADVVAASDKNSGAAVALNMADEKKSPRVAGLEMQEKVKKSKSTHVDVAKDTTLNTLPAFVLRAHAKDKGKNIILEMIWVSYDNKVYQLTGVASEGKSHVTSKAIRSFRKTSMDELSRVKIKEMDIVPAQEGETIATLSTRSGNKLKPELTAVINAVDKEMKMKEKKEIKVVLERAYNP